MHRTGDSSQKIKTQNYFCLSLKSCERDFIDDTFLIWLISPSPQSSLVLAGWSCLQNTNSKQWSVWGDCVLVSSYGPELMLFALWLRTSVHHGPVALFPLLTMDELFCSLCCLSSYSIDQFDANFGKDETNLPGSVRSTPRIKSNPHTSRKLRLDLVKNFLLNIFWRPKMFLVRKYFVIGVVHYSHDHISDKGCWSIILMFPSQSAKFWAKQIIHQ